MTTEEPESEAAALAGLAGPNAILKELIPLLLEGEGLALIVEAQRRAVEKGKREKRVAALVAAPSAARSHSLDDEDVGAFVAKLMEWISQRRRLGPHTGRRYFLVWYAHHVLIKTEPPISLLPHLAPYLRTQPVDRQTLREVERVLDAETLKATTGNYNSLRVEGARLAEEFRDSLTDEERIRWDPLLQIVIAFGVGTLVVAAASGAAAAATATKTSASAMKATVLSIALVGVLAAIAFVLCNGNAGKRKHAAEERHPALRDGQSAQFVDNTDQAGILAVDAAPEGPRVVGEPLLHMLLLSQSIRIEWGDIENAKIGWKDWGYLLGFPESDPERWARVAALDDVASTQARNGNHREALSTFEEYLKAKEGLWSIDVDCYLRLALERRAGVAPSEDCQEYAPNGPKVLGLLAYELALLHEGRGELEKAFTLFGDVVWTALTLSSADREVGGHLAKSNWRHLGTLESIHQSAGDGMARVGKRLEERGDAVVGDELVIALSRCAKCTPPYRLIPAVHQLRRFSECLSMSRSANAVASNEWEVSIEISDGSGVMEMHGPIFQSPWLDAPSEPKILTILVRMSQLNNADERGACDVIEMKLSVCMTPEPRLVPADSCRKE